MPKSAFVLVLLLATTGIDVNALSKYNHVIEINSEVSCSDSLVLQEGSVWILVDAKFPIHLAKCEINTDYTKVAEVNWHEKTRQVAFPSSGKVLMFLKNVDKSFSGLWHCMFLGPPPNVTVRAHCTIKVQLLGNSSSQYSSGFVPEIENRNIDRCATGIWTAVTIVTHIIYISILVAGIIFYTTKVSSESNIGPPSPRCQPFGYVDYEHKPLPNTPDNLPIIKPTIHPPRRLPHESVEYENKHLPTPPDHIYDHVSFHRPVPQKSSFLKLCNDRKNNNN